MTLFGQGGNVGSRMNRRNPWSTPTPTGNLFTGMNKTPTPTFTPAQVTPYPPSPGAETTPIQGQVTPQTPTPVVPPAPQAEATAVQPPSQHPSTLLPKAQQEATPIDKSKDLTTRTEPDLEAGKKALRTALVNFPSWGQIRFRTSGFDNALKQKVKPGLTGIQWLRKTYGDNLAWHIMQSGSQNPHHWIKAFEEPLPQEEDPVESQFNKKEATERSPMIRSRIGWGG